MKDFIEYLVKQIVSNPQAVVVDETVVEDNIFVYTIHVADEDIGVVIGKAGRNINSLRNMAKAKAIRDNTRVRVIVADGANSGAVDSDSALPELEGLDSEPVLNMDLPEDQA